MDSALDLSFGNVRSDLFVRYVSIGIYRLRIFAWDASLSNCRLESFVWGTFSWYLPAWNRSIGHCCLEGSLGTCLLDGAQFGIFGLGTLYGILRVGTFAWKLEPGNVRMGFFVR